MRTTQCYDLQKICISNMDDHENKKMYNYVPTLESLEYSLPLVIVLFLNLCDSCINDNT